MDRLCKANRFLLLGGTLRYKRYWLDFKVRDLENMWLDTGRSGFADKKKYIVETAPRVVERCILMTTDPGDLVLDPTCGSGTTATVAEQWGRRWITFDTSRVALALARARLMSTKYPYYFLADSREGRTKEQEVSGKIQPDTPTHNDVRQGFVYERAPHVTLKSIANNAEIDVLWEEAQATLEPLREKLNSALGRTSPSLRAEGEAIQEPPGEQSSRGPGSPRRSAPRDDDNKAWEEWQIPREADPTWPADVAKTHAAWWEARIER
jgi:adenine-specific DNA-methyltransferase